MENLSEYLVNPEFVDVLFPEGLFLKEVEVKNVHLVDGAKAKLFLGFKQLPAKPPKKWGAYFNALILELDIWGVSKVDISKWGDLNLCKFEIHRKAEHVVIKLVGWNCQLAIEGEYLYLQTLKPYQDERW